MGYLRISLLAGAMIAAGWATGAKAADFLFPRVPAVPVPAPVPVPVYSHVWYLRGDIAWSHQEDPDLRSVGASFSGEDIDETWGFGGGFGRYFRDNIRGDITIDYRVDADVTGVDTVTSSRHTTDLSSTVVLANVYYDIRGRDHFTPYVGVGLGFTHNRTDERVVTPGGLRTGGDSETGLALSAMAGLSYRLHEGWLFDAGYRYLYLGDAGADANGVTGALQIDDIHAHELRIGLRYELNGSKL